MNLATTLVILLAWCLAMPAAGLVLADAIRQREQQVPLPDPVHPVGPVTEPALPRTAVPVEVPAQRRVTAEPAVQTSGSAVT